MLNLNAKEQALLNSIIESVITGSRQIEFLASEVKTAKELERKGFILLTCTQVNGKKVYEVTLVDPHHKLVVEIGELIKALQAGCKALLGSDPEACFYTVGKLSDEYFQQKLQQELQQALTSKGLELFKKKVKG